jgi:hypothetical protein
MDPEMDHQEHCSTCFLASCAFSQCKVQFQSQSRQSAKLFLKSSELDSPNPSLAGERGVGRVPIPTRGHTLWYSLYRGTLWLQYTFKLYLFSRATDTLCCDRQIVHALFFTCHTI